jgi:bacillithiol biosynthesis cysteine-adding enzyme BshC
VALEFQFLPADVLGLPAWAGRVLANRPRPADTPGLIVPGELGDFPDPGATADPFDAEARKELATLLEKQLVRHRPHVAVLESVRHLREPHTMMVVAGQQPALLGGPLYDVYKALHAVALARALQRTWERPVVPAFWNHADDHDVAEVHHLWIQNPNLDLRKVTLAGMSSGRTPLGEIAFDEERHNLGALGELLRQNLWEGPEREQALELFLPRHGETFASAFTRLLLDLLCHLGLIVVEPSWIRSTTSHVLARLVTRDVPGALRAGAEAVRATGREPAIDPAEAALLFHHVDGKRQALRAVDGGYRYDGEEGSRTPVELAAEIVQEPGAWSPGALLRPVVQDLALPVAAYVGGWGELAYHSQIVTLRDVAGAPCPPFVPRLSATLVDGATRASLARLETNVAAVLQARGELASEEDGARSPAAVELRSAARRASELLRELQPLVAEEERGLAQQLKRAADQVEGLVEKLAAKLDRVRQNAAGSGRRHLRRVSNGLFPQGKPQERVRGALEFAARHGLGWIDELMAAIDPLPTEHVVAYFPAEETR